VFRPVYRDSNPRHPAPIIYVYCMFAFACFTIVYRRSGSHLQGECKEEGLEEAGLDPISQPKVSLNPISQPFFRLNRNTTACEIERKSQNSRSSM
jgi:hypothetical protein